MPWESEHNDWRSPRDDNGESQQRQLHDTNNETTLSQESSLFLGLDVRTLRQTLKDATRSKPFSDTKRQPNLTLNSGDGERIQLIDSFIAMVNVESLQVGPGVNNHTRSNPQIEAFMIQTPNLPTCGQTIGKQLFGATAGRSTAGLFPQPGFALFKKRQLRDTDRVEWGRGVPSLTKYLQKALRFRQL